MLLPNGFYTPTSENLLYIATRTAFTVSSISTFSLQRHFSRPSCFRALTRAVLARMTKG